MNTVAKKTTAKLAALNDDQLFSAWEATKYLSPSAETAITRDWIMKEIEARYPEGFTAWLDQSAPEDDDLRKFCLVNPLCLFCSRFTSKKVTGDFYNEKVKCNGMTRINYTGCVMRR